MENSELHRYGGFSSSNMTPLTKTGSVPMTPEEKAEYVKIHPGSQKKNKDFGFAKTALTLIKEKKREINLCRSITNESRPKSTEWGKYLEKRVFNMLGLGYKLESKIRYRHPVIDGWTGMPDTVRENQKVVGDIKCPWTLTSFCDAIESMESVELFKEMRPDNYWQLVSNGILTGCSRAELIVYCPYKHELEEITENQYDPDNPTPYFLNWIEDDEMPYLPEGSTYKNLNVFEFEIPKSDIIFLTGRVEEAVKLLHE